MERERFSLLGLLGRIALPSVLVYGTWNPSGLSFYDWDIAPFFSGRSWALPLEQPSR